MNINKGFQYYYHELFIDSVESLMENFFLLKQIFNMVSIIQWKSFLLKWKSKKTENEMYTQTILYKKMVE